MWHSQTCFGVRDQRLVSLYYVVMLWYIAEKKEKWFYIPVLLNEQVFWKHQLTLRQNAIAMLKVELQIRYTYNNSYPVVFTPLNHHRPLGYFEFERAQLQDVKCDGNCIVESINIFSAPFVFPFSHSVHCF